MEIVRVKLINSEHKVNGCEKAPTEILKELKKISLNERGKEIAFDKLRLGEIHVDSTNLKESNYLIFKNSRETFEKNNRSFFIGGDDSINYPICHAFGKTESNPLLILFDAHIDCVQKENHFMNRTWLGDLLKENFLGSRIILVSARSFDEQEIQFAKKNSITLISMDILQEDITGVCDLMMERARGSSGFLLNVDIDCVDPAFAPGTNLISPGGLSSRDLIYFIKRLNLLTNFKGAVITEINPEKDLNNMTVKLGAKLLSEML